MKTVGPLLVGPLLVVALFPAVLLGAPAITRMEGSSVVHKQPGVVVWGSGFGTKSQAAPYRHFSFEGGTPGARIPDEAAGGFNTSCNKSGYCTAYSVQAVRRPDTQSGHQRFEDGNYHNYIELNGFGSPAVYVSVWVLTNYTYGAPISPYDNVKIINAGTESGWQTRVDIYPNQGGSHLQGGGHTYAGDTCSSQGAFGKYQDYMTADEFHKTLGDVGQWHRWERWIDLGTVNGNDGWSQFWVDSALIGSVGPLTFRTSTQDSCSKLAYLLIGHYVRQEFGAVCHRFYDEIYVDTTRQRVEIGDASSWEASTHREIQTPITWSDTQVTFTVNQGALPPGAAYLWIVDQAGSVSDQDPGLPGHQGFPLTFCPAGSCDKPPPPVNLRIDGD